MMNVILVSPMGDEKTCLCLTDDQIRLLEFLEAEDWLPYGAEIIKIDCPEFQKI